MYSVHFVYTLNVCIHCFLCAQTKKRMSPKQNKRTFSFRNKHKINSPHDKRDRYMYIILTHTHTPSHHILFCCYIDQEVIYQRHMMHSLTPYIPRSPVAVECYIVSVCLCVFSDMYNVLCSNFYFVVI